MSAELPRILHAATPVAVSDYETRQARAELEGIAAHTLRRHAEVVQPVSGKDGSIELNLRLKTAGDLISYLVLSMTQYRLQGETSLEIDIVREFKDAEHFSEAELQAMAVLEQGKELGSRRICDYHYELGSSEDDRRGLWRTDWDFHHGRKLALDDARQYTPSEFCAFIMEDDGQEQGVGLIEVRALGMLLAAASPYPYEKLPDAGGFDI